MKSKRIFSFSVVHRTGPFFVALISASAKITRIFRSTSLGFWFWVVFRWAFRRWRAWRLSSSERKWDRLSLIFVSHFIIICFVQLYCSFVERKFLNRFMITFVFKSYRYFWANFLLSHLMLLQTLSKLLWVITFWVTAIVSSKFITACHHPPGMKTV